MNKTVKVGQEKTKTAVPKSIVQQIAEVTTRPRNKEKLQEKPKELREYIEFVESYVIGNYKIMKQRFFEQEQTTQQLIQVVALLSTKVNDLEAQLKAKKII